MRPERKREVIELVRRSPAAKKQMLFELGLSASTYYRWQRRYREQGEAGLVDRRPQPGTVWNRMKSEEEKAILGAAWESLLTSYPPGEVEVHQIGRAHV